MVMGVKYNGPFASLSLYQFIFFYIDMKQFSEIANFWWLYLGNILSLGFFKYIPNELFIMFR